MSKTLALMIDIETLALSPNAAVTQVGFCCADLDTRDYTVHPTALWLNPNDQKREIDFGTVQWWMAQDREVAKTVFTDREVRVSADHVFNVLQDIVRENAGCTVWGSPAMFDLPILTSLWGGKKPWAYNMERDLMTLYKLKDPDKLLQPPENTKHHDAAADAQWQLEYLMNIWAHKFKEPS